MKECSAYCRPEEGVHVTVGYVTGAYLPYVLASKARLVMVEDASDSTCLPNYTRVCILHAEKAVEAPVPPEWDGRTAVLYTVQVPK